MRKLTLLMFIVLAVAASSIASAAPAAAQTGPSDFGTGSSAVHTRTEGSYAPTRVPVATFADIKLSFRILLSRYFTMSWLPSAPYQRSSAADLPSRRRLL